MERACEPPPSWQAGAVLTYANRRLSRSEPATHRLLVGNERDCCYGVERCPMSCCCAPCLAAKMVRTLYVVAGRSTPTCWVYRTIPVPPLIVDVEAGGNVGGSRNL